MFTKKMRAFSAIVTVCMLLSLLAGFAAPVSAEENRDEILPLSGLSNVSALPDIKDGLTSASAYKVTDRAGMQEMAELTAEGETFDGITITMANDIDMSGTPFVGIGSSTNTSPTNAYNTSYFTFCGTFDGNGFVFKNLHISHGSVYGVGIFGNTMGATIKNVGIASGLIIGAGFAGSIVGYAHSTTIENCWNAATVIGGANGGTGGLIGAVADGKGALINSYNLGLVFNYTNGAAGLIGRTFGSAADYEIYNCYSAGTLVDGLAGFTNTSYTYFGAILRPESATSQTATDAADNYYLDTIGKPGWDKGVAISTKVKDGAKSFKASEFAQLHTKLNNNISSDSDAYAVEYTYSEAGFPVLTYKKGNSVVAKRLPAADAKNVCGNDWQDESALFATISAKAQKGLSISALEIDNANDLFVAAILTAFNSAGSNFGLASIAVTADIDMDTFTLADIEYFIPFGCNGTVNFNFDGQGHTITNWATYAYQAANYYPHGGFISDITAGTSVSNLSLENAYSAYDAIYPGNSSAYGVAYSYPSLLVERIQSKEASITDCSTTGVIETFSTIAENYNNNAGILARVWTNLATVRNCWTETIAVRSYTDTPEVYACRAIGSANTVPTDAKFDNVYWFADEELTDPNTGASDNKLIGTEIQTRMTPEEGHTEEIAVRLNNASAAALWTIKEVDGAKRLCRAADESETLVTLSVQKWLSTPAGYISDPIIYGEPTVAYYMRGTVYMPEAIPGYELDNEQELPVILDEDKTINYYMVEPDLSGVGPARELAAQFSPDFYDEEGIEIFEKLIAALDALDDAEEDELMTAIYEAMFWYEQARAYMQGGNIKMEYPNLPGISEYENYKYAGITDWAVKTKEDWAYATNILDPGVAANLRLHLTNDIDMQNTNVKPLAYGYGFTGLIDGHGYSFKNFKMEHADTNNLGNTTVGNEVSWGLVAYLEASGVIQNLGLASGSIKITNIGSQEQGVGGFAGVAHASSKIINCWNGMSINATNKNNPSRVAGIVGRGYCTLYGCYNWGQVSGNSAYTHGLNAYGQNGTGKFYNCYSLPAQSTNKASTSAIGQGGSYVSNASAPIDCYQNTWSVANYLIYDTEKLASSAAKAFSKAHTLTWEQYESGYMAYTMNVGAFNMTGMPVVYWTMNAQGETVHGTAANATRKVMLTMKGEGVETEQRNYYANGDSILNLDLGDYEVIETTIIDGQAVLTGNKLKLGGTDVVIELTVACNHKGTCSYTKNNDGTHNWACSACGMSGSNVKCEKVGAWKNDATAGKHSASCECGRVLSENCSYNKVEAVTGADTHKLTCVCGDSVVEDCVMTYELIGSNKHRHYCAVCRAGEESTCSYSEWIQTKAPTYTEFGSESRHCECGRDQTYPIAKLSGTTILATAGTAYAGEVLDIDLSFGNPPAAGVKQVVVDVYFDTSLFTWQSVSFNSNVDNIVVATHLNEGYVTLTITDARGVTVAESFATMKLLAKSDVPDCVSKLTLDVKSSDVAVGDTFALIDVWKLAWGDANGDKRTTIADVVTLLRAIEGEAVTYEKSACDVWHDRFQSEGSDNKITLSDAVLILRYIMGDYQPRL